MNDHPHRDIETLYRRGVAFWAGRDLEQARAVLEEALTVDTHAATNGWWFAASRALAQIALEQDDLDGAERHLARLPGHGVGDAQQTALRARHLFLSGETESAAIEVSIAVTLLATDDDRDTGTLMNGAIALMWCGEVLVDLGYGVDAARLAAQARQRIADAEVDDPVVDAGLAMVEAGAARLTGDAATATATLAAIDRTLSPDLGVQVKVETARLAWADGDREAARARYGSAIAECQSRSFPALVRLLRSEVETGPAPLRSDPYGVEDWAARSLDRALADHRPYGVVARLVMDRPLDYYRDLEQQVGALLGANPHLGSVDGTGSDGDVWELFLEGDDPHALWEAVAPLVTAVAGQGSRVDIRGDDDVARFPLS